MAERPPSERLPSERGPGSSERGSSEPPPSERPSLLGTMGRIGGVNVLAFGAGIARQKVFAVFLGPAGYGVYSLAASLYELLHTLARMGMHTGLLREMAGALGKGDEARAGRVYRTVRNTVVGGAVALAAGVVAAAPWISEHLLQGGLSPWAVRVVALGVPFIVGSAMADAALNALDRIDALAAGKAATILATLALLVVLAWRWGLEGALVQIAAGAAVGFAVSTLLLHAGGRGPAAAAAPGPAPPADPGPGPALERTTVLKAVLAIGVAQTLHHLAVTGNFFVFRSLVVAELGTFENGIYQGVMGISRQYLAAVTSGVFVFLYPRLSAAGTAGAFGRELRRSVASVTALAVPLAILLLAARDWIVRLVFTPEFLPMVDLMAWSLPADVLLLPAMLLHIAVLARGLTTAYVLTGVGAEAAYLAVFVPLLDRAGLTGTVVSYLVFAALSLALYAGVLLRRDLLSGASRLAGRLALGGLLVAAFAAAPLTLYVRAAAVAVAAAWILADREAIRAGAAS